MPWVRLLPLPRSRCHDDDSVCELLADVAFRDRGEGVGANISTLVRRPRS